MKKFWQFKNAATPGVVELLLYGEIKSEKSWIEELFGSSGIYAEEFVRDLQAMGDVSQITCRINSPGGDIFAAVAIYTQLKTHSARVVCIVDGIAASAATFILMAANEIQMPNGAMVMIHDPLAGLMGMYKADDLMKTAGTLNAIKESIVSIYAERTKTSKAKLLQMMSDETWMTADEAIEDGFCDKKIEGEVQIQMKGKVALVNNIEHDVSGFKNLNALEHAGNILDAIATANVGGGIAAQFVALAKKAQTQEDDPDGDGDGDGQDPDGDGDGAEGKKSKNKAKGTKDEIDDDAADEDENDEAKDKKANLAISKLANKYPKLVNRIVAMAKTEERQRIQEIDAISNRIDPALTAKAKYTDCTTAKDLAFEQMQASATKGNNYLAAFITSTQESGAKNVGAVPSPFSDAQPEQVRASIGESIANIANKIVRR